jgi:hypothetical protein
VVVHRVVVMQGVEGEPAAEPGRVVAHRRAARTAAELRSRGASPAFA